MMMMLMTTFRTYEQPNSIKLQLFKNKLIMSAIKFLSQAPSYSKTTISTMMVMMNNNAHDFRSNLAPTIISTMMKIVYYDQRHSQSSSNLFANNNINEGDDERLKRPQLTITATSSS